nr:rRNA maturation RNase YbeY [Candidatus Paceibacterota bacterium]
SKAKAREINKKYRQKDKPTNILSFPFSTEEGEILLCKELIKEEVKNKEDKTEGRNYTEWLGFLVIHGMLHLKGYVHSSKMDRAEAKYDKKYFDRDRRGLHNNTSRSGRVSKRRIKS